MFKKPIYVTHPTLAPLEEVSKYLARIWETGIISNDGPLLQEFEDKLKTKFEVPYLSVVLNGTIGLQMAIKALDLKGEIITTPFTYVATVCAINWEGCKLIFCDIDPDTLNMDVNKIEALITPDTVAIMPVHIFGVACDVEAIEKIAKKHNLKVIYDAAHAIGTEINGQSIFNYGDISVTSMHATKLLNSGEGGFCVTPFQEIDQRLREIRFYGHDADREITTQGLNGKMTEIHAAVGLANLPYYDGILADRKQKYLYYKELLSDLSGISLQKVERDESNYSYFPVVFESEELLLTVEKSLREKNIYCRRYFYPSINQNQKIVEVQSAPISESISPRIMCLPLSYQMQMEEIQKIAAEVRKELKLKVFREI